MKTDPLRYVLLLFLLLGIIFSGVAVYNYKSQKDFIKSAIEVDGTVVDYQPSRKGMKAPIIEYLDREGKLRVYYHDVYSKPTSHDIGEKVKIYYKAENPEDVRLGGDYVLTLIFGFLGLIFTLVSVVCIKVFWISDPFFVQREKP